LPNLQLVSSELDGRKIILQDKITVRNLDGDMIRKLPPA